jgi:ribosomal protein S25
MKNQKKSSEIKTETQNEKWITPQEAANKLGLSFNVENTYSFKEKKVKENAAK